ncbi:Serine protease, subtilisin family [Prosthecobacter debontii]|uniref:Serine protease, subtilisin family n=1 Tax=Prosthecobacter debontii TaxID=48467 RepID=A0A1T4YC33_9BACT|nr:S8 family serine peptidase [Prosthecobacter debontii]SKA99253.1 Serine protease, subtilisin family [Prosthecobacter debontii]
MKTILQRLLVVAALSAFGIATWLWLNGERTVSPPIDPLREKAAVATVATVQGKEQRMEDSLFSRPGRAPSRLSAAGLAQAQVSGREIKISGSDPEQPNLGRKDRYAGKEVLEEKETVQQVQGLTQVERVRLVRDPSFKYPLVRVVDELVRSPQGDRLVRQVAMVGDHVLVKPQQADMSEAALLEQLQAQGATLRKKMPASGNWLVAFSPATLDTVPDMVARISAMKSFVRYAEPDYIMSANAVPNDSSFNLLWGMNNTGESGGVVDADIDAPEAWNLATGSASVKVAVIDSGIDQTHPDLVPNLWTNPDEIAGNGVDDDGNGYVDDVHGWDFVNSDANPTDDNGHGTHCAGTIGAVGNNGSGVAGVCWNVSLIGLKFLDASGSGSLTDAVEAIAYATQLGVTLTSNSWSGGDYAQAMKDVIDEAGEAGVLFVTVAGNSSNNVESFPEYPGSYTSGNLIAVAATTYQETLADFSNYGAVSTDLAAPGQDIYSTVPGGGYGYNSGTSMACPHVAGACALVKSFKPSLTHLQVKDIILKSVDSIPVLAGKNVTGGRLNVFNALLASDDMLVTPGSALVATGPLGGPFTPTSQTYTITNYTQQNAVWTASLDQPWATLSATSGTLSAGESIKVTVSLNEQTEQLTAGNQTATLTFTHTGTGRSQTRPVTVVVNPDTIYTEPLDADPGWTRTGQWQFGVPQGLGGTSFGYPDPKRGATGSHVFGINLAGDYSTSTGAAQYLTTGPINLSRYQNTRLKFQRWLNSDYQTWVYATLEVSTNGSTWTPLWNNGTDAYNDGAWTPVEYDLSAYADGQAQVYLRWGHQVASFGAYPYSGWNIDDVQIQGVPNVKLALTLPESVTEGGAAGQGTITVTPAPSTNLSVTLTSSRPGEEVSVPATVSVLSGQTQAIFAVTPLQDNFKDGSQKVTLTATAVDYPTGSASLLVHDDEQDQLFLLLPASLPEGSGTVTNQATISINDPAPTDLTVYLSSNDLTEVQVPASVTIPQGEVGVFFPLSIQDDPSIDGPQTVTVTASVVNWPSRQSTMIVTDNEASVITLTLPAKRLESAGLLPNQGQVSVPGLVPAPLTISLTSNRPQDLIVPASVTIPAGSSDATFALHPQDDAVVDGDPTVEITASSPNFTSARATIIIADDEVPALPSDPFPSAGQISVSPSSPLVWSYDHHSGAAPTSYRVYFRTGDGPEDLLGTTVEPYWALTLPKLQPSTTYHWRVVALAGAGSRNGPSWTFTTVTPGPLHHYAWDPLPEVVAVGVPFPVRVTAVDAYEIPVTGYRRQAQLTAQIQQPESTTGTGSYPWIYPLSTSYHDVRIQSIYRPEEAGPAGQLTALALNLGTVPGQTLTNFTIRMRHTTKTDYLSGGFTWESDWTTVYSADQTLSATGWVWFTFTTPFDYDGTQNLMVDFSFNNTSYSTDGTTRTTIISDYRTLAYRTDSNYGDPLSWSGSSPTAEAYNGLPNLRLQRASQPLALTPTTTTPFNQGSWSGQVTLQAAGVDAQLVVTDTVDSAVTSSSSAIDAIAVEAFTLATEPTFTGGTSNQISGAALSAGHLYEIQRATQPNFNDAVSSGPLNTPEHLFTGLSDGKLYYYRGRGVKEGASGQWSVVERSTQDATAPLFNFERASDGITLLSSLDLIGSTTDATSGVASLEINGTPFTPGAFTTPLTLTDGLNNVTLTATDNATPPNTRSITWTVTRIPDLDLDADANGLSGLLEYAFHANSSSASALPTLSTALHPETHRAHLILRYRRLITPPSNLVYDIETSSGLEDWVLADSTTAEVLSTTPTGDGFTELVTVRINPSLEGQIRRFARLNVRTLTP